MRPGEDGRARLDRRLRRRIRTGAGDRAALAALVGVLGGCAGANREIVEDRFYLSEASGLPEISDITDGGGGDVPLSGTLTLDPSDGAAVIGETLWIQGHSFGRQPTVQVGGRPAAVLGRTRDGGIVVRVPPSTPSGSEPVVVSNEVGKGERPIAVKRYVAVLAPDSGQLGWAEVGASGPIAAGHAAAPGARFLALSADGRAAYLVQAARSGLDVIELPAPGAPKIVYRLDLGAAAVVAVAAATRAQVLAVIRTDDVVLVDTTSPLRPARSTPRALPKEVREGRVVAADLSPDGKLLALATEEGNQVLLVDLASRGRASLVGSISLLPEVRESALVDLAFSAGGDTLWVLSGDTARTRVVGPQPTELRAIRVASDPQRLAHLDVARVVRIAGAVDPVRLGVGRAAPLASGGAIRLPPERGTVFVSAATAAIPAGTTAPVLQGAGVFRVGDEEDASLVIAAPGHIGLPDLTFEGRWLLVPVLAADGAVRILSAAVDGRPALTLPRPTDVIAGPRQRGASFLGERCATQLRIQP